MNAEAQQVPAVTTEAVEAKPLAAHANGLVEVEEVEEVEEPETESAAATVDDGRGRRQFVKMTTVDGKEQTFSSIREASDATGYGVTVVKRLIDHAEFSRKGERFAYVPFVPKSATGKQVQIHLPDAVYAALEAHAATLKMRPATYARDVLERYLVSTSSD